eukprot:m.132407 g.132407  ORF g.132407 m.132407 type:complete len:567 (+) comp29604_c0_seq1:220-1920(+)
MSTFKSASVLVCLLLTACTYGQDADTDYEVIWQFQRDGLSFWGETNRAQLPDIYITTGNTVTFKWSFALESLTHSLYMTTDQAKFDACDTTGDVTTVAFFAANGDHDFSLDAGTYYFFDRVDVMVGGTSYCEQGQMKQVVYFQTPEDFDPPETTPPPAVDDKENATDVNATIILWRYNEIHEQIFMTQDESVRFLWSTDEKLSVWQVTEEAFTACSLLTGGLEQLTDGPQEQGDILVQDLPVGDNYFISGQPTHCAEGDMKIKITVVPGLARLWVNVWSDTTTTDPVNLTLTGFDAQGRVWTSPARQVNQQAVITDFSLSETIPISEDSNFFEMYALDVGAAVSVHVQRTPGDAFVATYVRVRKPDSTTESVTFRCGAAALHHEITNIDDQHCVVATEEIALESNRVPYGSPGYSSCSCYREFQIVDDRVLVCTSDGCFSTSSDSLNGWSDMVEVSRILGVGSDGHYYGKDGDNQTLVSRNSGLTWVVPTVAAPIVTEALSYSFDVDFLTRVPLDEHTFGSPVIWGLTAQGVHTNVNGTWQLHGLWACNCAGACGLECNQPDPHLL